MNATDFKDDQFKNIYVTYSDTVYKYVLVSLGFNYTLTDDCMQDIFLLLLQKKDIVINHPNPGGFLIVTAKNYIKKYQTAAANYSKKETPLDDNLQQLSYEEDYSHIFEENIDIHLLKDEILKQLNDNEITLYELFYEQKLSIAEISEKLNLTQSNIKTRLFRLRIRVKKMVHKLFNTNGKRF